MTVRPEDRLRLDNVRAGQLHTGPETLQINLTNACNLRCVFCWNHSPLVPVRSSAWHGERLSEPHLDRVIGALPALRPGSVLISGRGEPFLHQGVERLLAALHELAIPVTIQTNGSAGPAPGRLRELGVERLLVNLSAGTPDGYLRTHPRAGAATFERVLRRLKAVRSGASGGPRVTLVAVIQRSNMDDILALVERCAEVGADQLYLKGMELAAGLAGLVLDAEARDTVRREVARAGRLAHELGVTLHAEHLAQVLDAAPAGDGAFTPSLRGGPCFMGWYYLRVTCDGRVMFCCKDKQVDHLDRRELYAIWRSSAYHLLRLAGRDSDMSAGLFDDKCSACSNFGRNREVGRLMDVC